MRKLASVILLTVVAASLLQSSAWAQLQGVDYEWKLKRDRRGIQVFLSKVPDSKFRAVLSVMNIDAETRELAALVMDLDNCPNWAAMCKKAKVIERISPTQSYVYSLSDAPFPVRDRDVVAKVIWSYNQETGKVSMQSRAVEGKLEKNKGVIRVEEAVSEWHFTPQPDGTVLVENYAHVDPNGGVPAWLTNLLIIESPYKTMKQMRKQVMSGKYSDADVAFIPGKESDS